jgi:DNA-binding response OmpR family regulator
MRRSPTDSPPQGLGIPLLVASPFPNDYDALRTFCDAWKWKLYRARTCDAALKLVRQHRIPVVICDRDLPGGDWRVVGQGLREVPNKTRLIVSSRLADHRLCIDVLEHGGYDVLTSPFDSEEVFRAVFMAWHALQNEWPRDRTISAAVA